MVKLKNNSKWVSLFLLSQRTIDKFCDVWREFPRPEKTNICIFFWTLMAAAGILLINALVYFSVVWVLIFQPFLLFGLPYLTFWGIILMLLVFAGATILSLIGAEKGINKILSKRRTSKRSSETWNLIKASYRSWKEKTCILISWEKTHDA